MLPAAEPTIIKGRSRVLGGVTVVEDYAHHPTEIASTLRAARLLNPGRILVVFQPHLYTRTKFFSRVFGEALAAAREDALSAMRYVRAHAGQWGLSRDRIGKSARTRATSKTGALVPSGTRASFGW